MILENPTLETLERLRFVQNYLDNVIEKMGSEFFEAYVFGDTARNNPFHNEPVEILFTFRESPIKKYTFFTTGLDGSYAREGRDLNHAFHARCVEPSQYGIRSKVYIPIKSYFYYPNVPIEKTLFILTSVDQRRFELIKAYGIKYPDDISKTLLNTLTIF